MEWIPVDEKAPEIGQRIICTGIGGSVYIGYYCGCIEGAYRRKKHVASMTKYPTSTCRTEIEAWMPAPKPYAYLEKQKAFRKIRAQYYNSKRRR